MLLIDLKSFPKFFILLRPTLLTLFKIETYPPTPVLQPIYPASLFSLHVSHSSIIHDLLILLIVSDFLHQNINSTTVQIVFAINKSQTPETVSGICWALSTLCWTNKWGVLQNSHLRVVGFLCLLIESKLLSCSQCDSRLGQLIIVPWTYKGQTFFFNFYESTVNHPSFSQSVNK